MGQTEHRWTEKEIEYMKRLEEALKRQTSKNKPNKTPMAYLNHLNIQRDIKLSHKVIKETRNRILYQGNSSTEYRSSREALEFILFEDEKDNRRVGKKEGTDIRNTLNSAEEKEEIIRFYESLPPQHEIEEGAEKEKYVGTLPIDETLKDKLIKLIKRKNKKEEANLEDTIRKYLENAGIVVGTSKIKLFNPYKDNKNKTPAIKGILEIGYFVNYED